MEHSLYSWELHLSISLLKLNQERRHTLTFTDYDSMKDFEDMRKAGIYQSACKGILECKEFLWVEFHGSLSLTCVPEL